MARIASPNRHELQAPRQHRGVLLFPAPEDWTPLFEKNQQHLCQQVDLQGRSLAALRELARSELLDAAKGYTSSYRDLPEVSPTGPLLLAGHQAELYHPGVWAKNFALHRLGKQLGGTCINLIVDSDLLKTAALKVPAGSVAEPTVEQIPFDQHPGQFPAEAIPVRDWELFRSFPTRVSDRLARFVPESLITTLWPKVVERAESTNNLGLAFSQARHQVEAEWGLESLEFPLSHSCQFEAFGWFAIHLLSRLPCFWSIYNQAIQDYRREHKIRSLRHPFSDLAEEGDWLEAPFWIWTESDPTRRRLFARQSGNELILSDHTQNEVRLPLTPESEGQAALEQFLALNERGIKIRTRALTTTMWARVLLGDMFVHGLGGAKYDQVTDQVIQQFFGLQPPDFLTVTATLRLPIPALEVHDQDLQCLDEALRDLTWNPQRYLSEHLPADRQAVLEKIKTKHRWIDTEPNPQNYRERFRAIRRSNRELQPYLQPRRALLEQLRQDLEAAQHFHRIAHSREYSFCLFPETELREFLCREVAAISL